MRCMCVPRLKVPIWWPVCRDWVRAACAAIGFEVDPLELGKRLERDDDILLIMLMKDNGLPFGCMVVEIFADRIHVTSVGTLRGFAPRGWVPAAIEHLDEIARVVRVPWITGRGRVGWERVAGPYGFAWDGECYRKAV